MGQKVMRHARHNRQRKQNVPIQRQSLRIMKDMQSEATFLDGDGHRDGLTARVRPNGVSRKKQNRFEAEILQSESRKQQRSLKRSGRELQRLRAAAKALA